MWNPLYSVGSYFANKYQRAFLITYATLLGFIGAVSLLLIHAHHYLEQPSCGDEHNGPKSLNCYFAGITLSISKELIMFSLIILGFVLPHATHILLQICVAVWQHKKSIAVGTVWAVVFVVAKLANDAGLMILEGFVTQAANMTVPSTGEGISWSPAEPL
ncbi:uncharacterized protein AB675_9470 [Cyphellophora attinorum]|uniref:Uncharacterized protein n=1 Tax=Cyphellophora attinorum TaxID=1664694 RepID=A0A0N1H7G6_9EURO|nr:uncharacterized protein AB675_9470 [Phialophora attinorum]KPI42442.1 hypothetical protein AB675_9470 [Phialophora attinorum]